MKIKYRSILICHYIASFFAFTSILEVAAHALWQSRFDLIAFRDIAPWAGLPGIPKSEVITGYLLMLCAMALMAASILTLGRGGERRMSIGPGAVAGFIAFETLLHVGAVTRWGGAIDVLVVVAYVAVPLAFHLIPDPDGSTRRQRVIRGVGVLCAVTNIAAVLIFFSPRPPLILNEFRDLPDYTRFSDGVIAETREFAAESGFRSKWRHDPCVESVQTNDVACIKLPRDAFATPREAFMLFPPNSGLEYLWDSEYLTARGKPSAEASAIIRAVWNLAENDSRLIEWLRLASMTGPRAVDDMMSISPAGRSRLDEFLSFDLQYVAMQDYVGRMIYHHAYTYLPMAERAYGRDRPGLGSQYGQGLTDAGAWMLRRVGISFENYYRIYWMVIPVYVAAAAVAGWVIGGGVWGTMVALMVITISFAVTGETAFDLAPGFNPVRHLPDLLCFVLIFWDTRRRSVLSSLARAAAVGGFIWWNREFGMFLLAGSLAWRMIDIVFNLSPRRSAMLAGAAEIVAAAAALLSLDAMPPNGLGLYTVMGLATPVTHVWIIAPWVLVWSALLYLPLRRALLNRVANVDVNERARDAVGVAGACYCAAAGIYPLWNPSIPHASVLLLCALPAIVAVVGKPRDFGRNVIAVACVAMLPFAWHFAVVHHDAQREYKHRIFFPWEFSGLKGQVSANPKPIEEGLALIEKYQPTGRLIFISQYDSLLSIVSGRFSALPYVDIKSSIVSYKLLDLIKSRILESDRKYIFVDKDVFDSLGSEKSADKVKAQRSGQQGSLGLLAREIREYYSPIEESGVLQVWQKKSEAVR